MGYEFEKEVYRYKCFICRNIFCMPNCGTCPNCSDSPEQENSICSDCLEEAFSKPLEENAAQKLIKPGQFVAVGHDQVMHCCSSDKEYHIWQR